jgi:hypothetical protein
MTENGMATADFEGKDPVAKISARFFGKTHQADQAYGRHALGLLG